MTARQRKQRAVRMQRRNQPPRVHSVPITGENSLGPEESVAEAESELGQNDWIDPDTGELAEGESPPRLDKE